TLRSVHKMVNHPDKFRELVDKIHSYGILVFGLFMFGFDTDDETVFDETVAFNIDAGYDMCAYSVLTPYPGTLTWYEMQKDKRMVSYDWDNYDQGHIVYKPNQLTPEQLREGHMRAYSKFYSMPSIAQRFPLFGTRSRTQYSIYNLFFRRGEVTGRYIDDAVAKPTEIPNFLPEPPLMPKHRQWVELITENNHY
ncbi:MAG: radical SAM protein, partial [Gammaproteobacteria bacterium]|nr:radical SAM protein [Gammaproteobacteria bacterium]